jgi:hypothetical protein
MFTCCKCDPSKNQHPRGISYFRNGTFVEYCRVHDPANRAALVACRNAFEGFTIQHVHDERGKPIKVNSIKELRAAEKKHGFVLNCATNDNGDTSEAPRHESWAGDLTHGYKKKWQRDPDAYKSPEAQKSVMAGVARSANETLAGRPNPL